MSFALIKFSKSNNRIIISLKEQIKIIKQKQLQQLKRVNLVLWMNKMPKNLKMKQYIKYMNKQQNIFLILEMYHGHQLKYLLKHNKNKSNKFMYQMMDVETENIVNYFQNKI